MGMTEPTLKDWTTVNNVYFKDGKSQFGYVIRNREGKEKKISMFTANKMFKKGLLEFGFAMAIVTNKKKGLITVHEGFPEDLTGIDLGEE
jgi:hypothetical protein